MPGGFRGHQDRIRPYGSRSLHQLPDALTEGGNYKTSELSYNGFNFPPAITSRITIVPEYDKSERLVKWLTIAINYEFILTEYNELPEIQTKESEELIDKQIQYATAREVIVRLSQQGQVLKMDAQGFGKKLRVNDDTDPKGIWDLDYGPKPQVLEYEPLGGGAAFRVQWLCVTRISPLFDDYTGKYVEFSYGEELEFIPSGHVQRTISGELVLPAYANSTVYPEEHIGHYGVPIISSIRELEAKQYILSRFPILINSLRNVVWSVSENKRSIKFKITDVEKLSNSYLPPGVGDFELKQTLTSSIDDGFTNWKLTYTGRISAFANSFGYVPGTQGVTIGRGVEGSKKLAWYWLWKILKYKRILFETATDLPDGTEVNASTEFVDGEGESDEFSRAIVDMTMGTGSTPEKLKGGNFSFTMYPTYISITDNIYGNDIDFTISYFVSCTATLLIKALGIFQSVHSESGLDKDSHARYIGNFPLAPPIEYLPEQSEVLIDIATPFSEEISGGISSEASASNQITGPFDHKNPEKGKDWVDYQVDFRYYEDHTTVKCNRLKSSVINQDIDPGIGTNGQPVEKRLVNGDGELQHRPYNTGPLVPAQQNTALPDIYANAPTETKRYVIMEGRAARWSGPIAPPTLLSVGGAKAYKDSTLGMDEVVARTKKVGLSGPDGKIADLYVLHFRKYYVLDRIPSDATMETTANVRRFS